MPPEQTVPLTLLTQPHPEGMIRWLWDGSVPVGTAGQHWVKSDQKVTVPSFSRAVLTVERRHQ